MKKDFSFPPYWPGLYPIEQKGKIDLLSGTFYDDALKYFCKDGSDNKQLMDCFKFQSYRIENIDEWYEVKAVWERRKRIIEMTMMFRHESIEHIPKKKFVEAVGEILDGIKLSLDQKQTNRDDQMNALKKKAKRDAIIIQSLVDRSASQSDMPKIKIDTNKDNESEIIPPPDFSAVLSRIKYDKDEATKNKVKDILKGLSESKLFEKSNGLEFGAIALIIHQTGWVVNTKTFKEWLTLFSVAFRRRKIPTYKPNKLQTEIETIKRKYPFIDPPPKH